LYSELIGLAKFELICQLKTKYYQV